MSLATGLSLQLWESNSKKDIKTKGDIFVAFQSPIIKIFISFVVEFTRKHIIFRLGYCEYLKNMRKKLIKELRQKILFSRNVVPVKQYYSFFFCFFFIVSVIIICAEKPIVRQILLAAEELNMIDNGEYVFFSVELYRRWVIIFPPFFQVMWYLLRRERMKYEPVS